MDREEKDIIEGIREELAGIREAQETLVAIASAPRTACGRQGVGPWATWPASRRSHSPAPEASALAFCRKSGRPWAGWA